MNPCSSRSAAQSPPFSPVVVAKPAGPRCGPALNAGAGRAFILHGPQGHARRAPGGRPRLTLTDTSRSPTKRNAVMADESGAAVDDRREMRARSLRGRARRTRIHWDLRGSSEENRSILPIRQSLGLYGHKYCPCIGSAGFRFSGLCPFDHPVHPS